MSVFTDRLIRAARLDVSLYEEVEADSGAMSQAMGVVVLSSLAAGIGSLSVGGIGGILLSTLSALIGWFVWAWLIYFIGTQILPEPQTECDIGQMLRTTGFASAPGVIRVIGIVPGLGMFVFFVASVWMLVAMVIAVRQALDFESTWRAVGVCMLCWLVQTAVIMILMSLAGGAALTS